MPGDEGTLRPGGRVDPEDRPRRLELSDWLRCGSRAARAEERAARGGESRGEQDKGRAHGALARRRRRFALMPPAVLHTRTLRPATRRWLMAPQTTQATSRTSATRQPRPSCQARCERLLSHGACPSQVVHPPPQPPHWQHADAIRRGRGRAVCRATLRRTQRGGPSSGGAAGAAGAGAEADLLAELERFEKVRRRRELPPPSPWHPLGTRLAQLPPPSPWHPLGIHLAHAWHSCRLLPLGIHLARTWHTLGIDLVIGCRCTVWSGGTVLPSCL